MATITPNIILITFMSYPFIFWSIKTYVSLFQRFKAMEYKNSISDKQRQKLLMEIKGKSCLEKKRFVPGAI
ncbi:MAG: hypothetical protein D6748_07935 [Calditrichaeota bacterium]|nr:MAG: hypothetical protein D6748_07935 [Calditrichota bacterium]